MQNVFIKQDKLDIKKIYEFWGEMGDQPGQKDNPTDVIINNNVAYQTIDGIGGSFSEIGGKLLNSLTEDKRNEVARNLFDAKTGAGFTFCRLPIGASDFGLSAYSLNDNENDFSMDKLSLERDEQHLIPYIKHALKYNPELQIHASPWSPPGWLKTNNSMVNGGSLIDKTEYYQAYALYLTKYIEAYKAHGIDIKRLLIQNEPDIATPYPSCLMLEDQMIRLVVNYLNPEFIKNKIDTEIWAGTFRTITRLQAQNTMVNEDFRSIVKGIGVQYSLPQHVYDLQRICPEKKIMHTESVCYDGKNSWEQAAKLFYDFMTYMNLGCSVYTYWNMILDQTSKSTWGWSQNSLIKINTDTSEITYNPDFEVMKLLSANVRPDAKRIGVFSFEKKVIAFENTDKSTVLLVMNVGEVPEKIKVTHNKKVTVCELPPKSISTITLNQA